MGGGWTMARQEARSHLLRRDDPPGFLYVLPLLGTGRPRDDGPGWPSGDGTGSAWAALCTREGRRGRGGQRSGFAPLSVLRSQGGLALSFLGAGWSSVGAGAGAKRLTVVAAGRWPCDDVPPSACASSDPGRAPSAEVSSWSSLRDVQRRDVSLQSGRLAEGSAGAADAQGRQASQAGNFGRVARVAPRLGNENDGRFLEREIAPERLGVGSLRRGGSPSQHRPSGSKRRGGRDAPLGPCPARWTASTTGPSHSGRSGPSSCRSLRGLVCRRARWVS